ETPRGAPDRCDRRCGEHEDAQRHQAEAHDHRSIRRHHPGERPSDRCPEQSSGSPQLVIAGARTGVAAYHRDEADNPGCGVRQPLWPARTSVVLGRPAWRRLAHEPVPAYSASASMRTASMALFPGPPYTSMITGTIIGFRCVISKKYLPRSRRMLCLITV